MGRCRVLFCPDLLTPARLHLVLNRRKPKNHLPHDRPRVGPRKIVRIKFDFSVNICYNIYVNKIKERKIIMPTSDYNSFDRWLDDMLGSHIKTHVSVNSITTRSEPTTIKAPKVTNSFEVR